MYKQKTHIHFIGIGGIGMSAIAAILHHQGYIISGCDADTEQNTVAHLKSLGCRIYHGNNSQACHDDSINIIVYIPMYANTIELVTHEIKRAQLCNVPTVSRAQMLAELMRTKYSIAITGSHGKTTTSSLIAHILLQEQKDPTIIIGGHLKNINANHRIGNGKFLVTEADESDRSLLQLLPTIAVITNIDLEHLETYANLDDIKQTFKEFINKLPFYGAAIINADDLNTCSLLPLKKTQTVSYGINNNADFYARDIILNNDHSLFTVYSQKNPTPLGSVQLPMPGIHNVYNALASIALASEIGINFNNTIQHLSSFAGIERRFSWRGTYKGAHIFDDYGHHPKEIGNTLLVARKQATKKLIVVFQPHRYTRTQKLWTDFLHVFAHSAIDSLIITDIYSAGESPISGINSAFFAQALRELNSSLDIHYVPFTDNFNHIKEKISLLTQENDLLLLLGAGKTHLIPQYLVEQETCL